MKRRKFIKSSIISLPLLTGCTKDRVNQRKEDIISPGWKLIKSDSTIIDIQGLELDVERDLYFYSSAEKDLQAILNLQSDYVVTTFFESSKFPSKKLITEPAILPEIKEILISKINSKVKRQLNRFDVKSIRKVGHIKENDKHQIRFVGNREIGIVSQRNDENAIRLEVEQLKVSAFYNLWLLNDDLYVAGGSYPTPEQKIPFSDEMEVANKQRNQLEKLFNDKFLDYKRETHYLVNRYENSVRSRD